MNILPLKTVHFAKQLYELEGMPLALRMAGASANRDSDNAINAYTAVHLQCLSKSLKHTAQCVARLEKIAKAPQASSVSIAEKARLKGELKAQFQLIKVIAADWKGTLKSCGAHKVHVQQYATLKDIEKISSRRAGSTTAQRHLKAVIDRNGHIPREEYKAHAAVLDAGEIATEVAEASGHKARTVPAREPTCIEPAQPRVKSRASAPKKSVTFSAQKEIQEIGSRASERLPDNELQKGNRYTKPVFTHAAIFAGVKPAAETGSRNLTFLPARKS